MSINYQMVQGLINFGRGLAGDFVGQPFQVYRLNSTSTGDVLDPANVVNQQLNAKLTHGRKIDQMENEYLHTNAFEVMCSSDAVRIGDILVQNDPIYGANGAYAIASLRPLKKVMAIRVESLCTIRRQAARPAAGRYSGPNAATDQLFVMTNGVFAPTAPTTPPAAAVIASNIPVGIQTIGQIKNQKPEHLPLDTMTTWWFLYLPLLPGLDLVQENDVIVVRPTNQNGLSTRFRVHSPYASPVGTAGQFLLCEKQVP